MELNFNSEQSKGLANFFFDISFVSLAIVVILMLASLYITFVLTPRLNKRKG